MSWGTRITILYSGFVLMIIALVVMSMRQTIELEDDHYYEKEIKFESQLTAMRNTATLSAPFTVKVNSGNLEIYYPQEILEDLKGNLTLFRPSDKSLDKIFSIACNAQGVQYIPLDKIKPGNYKIKIDAVAGGKDFYFEETVFVP